MPQLSHLTLFPIKSLDGVSIPQATVLASGALQGDREFAIVDQAGKIVNGKRTAAVHQIRSRFDLAARSVAMRIEGTSATHWFELDGDRRSLATWLSEHFGFAVRLIQNTEQGFPDDTDSPGPTVISTATLHTIGAWFPDLCLDDIRRRFRTNLEIADVEPFWEEQLYAQAGRCVEFQIGAVRLQGVNPCQRCVVITRDPHTGEPMPNFQKVFIAHRQATLPEWVERSRFNHFYRLAINTRIAAGEAGKTLAIGDEITLHQ